MWQVVRELSKHLGGRYTADQVLQLLAEQDVSDACRPELTGNLGKAQLDCEPMFLSLLNYWDTR